jgi:hypothetical protein
MVWFMRLNLQGIVPGSGKQTMGGKILLCLIMTLALTMRSSYLEAAEFAQFNGQGIIIRYDAPLRKAAESLAESYPGIRREVERKLAWKTDFIPRVILVRRHDLFLRESGNDLVTAFAVPRENFIVVDYSQMGKTPFAVRSTFAHELCHLLLHRHIKADFLPKWLDEGIAQWVAGSADILDIGERNILRQATISGNLLPLDSISLRFPDQPAALSLSYEESRSFVEFVVHEYGEGKLLAILDGLHRERTVARAVSENLPVGLSRLERNWRAALLKKYSWQAYLADRLSWILFFLGALGTVCGYLKLRKRLKNYRDGEDQDLPGGEETGQDQ